jgi:hypothetical protein
MSGFRPASERNDLAGSRVGVVIQEYLPTDFGAHPKNMERHCHALFAFKVDVAEPVLDLVSRNVVEKYRSTHTLPSPISPMPPLRIRNTGLTHVNTDKVANGSARVKGSLLTPSAAARNTVVTAIPPPSSL